MTDPMSDIVPPLNALYALTLRDWFAGQALAGMADQYAGESYIAMKAYAIADAMLARREAQPLPDPPEDIPMLDSVAPGS